MSIVTTDQLPEPTQAPDDPEPVAVAWTAFADGCPSCGAKPHDAPEGVNRVGEPHWNFPHCFKCGFRFGTNTVSNEQQMYEAFKRFMAERPEMKHPTLQPPADDAAAADLRRQLDEAMGELARLRPETTTTTEQQAFTPATNPNIPNQPPSQQGGMFAAPSPMGEQTGQVPPPGTVPPAATS